MSHVDIASASLQQCWQQVKYVEDTRGVTVWKSAKPTTVNMYETWLNQLSKFKLNYHQTKTKEILY